MEDEKRISIMYEKDMPRIAYEKVWYAEAVTNDPKEPVLALLDFMQIKSLKVFLYNDETDQRFDCADEDTVDDMVFLWVNENEDCYQMAVSIYQAICNAMEEHGRPVSFSVEDFQKNLPAYYPLKNRPSSKSALEYFQENIGESTKPNAKKNMPAFMTSRRFRNEIILNPFKKDRGLLPYTVNAISIN